MLQLETKITIFIRSSSSTQKLKYFNTLMTFFPILSLSLIELIKCKYKHILDNNNLCIEYLRVLINISNVNIFIINDNQLIN